MKIIEALKELPLIKKKIDKNEELLKKYSSSVGVKDHPEFDLSFATPGQQAIEVKALLQSTVDLCLREACLRKTLARTNSIVEVKIGSSSRTISEWISFRLTGIPAILRSLESLSTNRSLAIVRQPQGNSNLASVGVENLTVVMHYDEKSKNEEVTKWMTMLSEIDSKLEIANAITDLVEVADKS